MVAETKKKIINFPKQDLIDFIDLSFESGMDASNSFVLSDDPQAGSFVFKRNLIDYQTLDEEVSYSVTYADLVSNVLIQYDPDIVAGDITAVKSGFDTSKIIVEY